MTLIFKIAAGVFLGILAAFGLYMVLQIWESQARAKRVIQENQKAAQKMESEAITQRKRILKAAFNFDQLLMPEKMVALCGTPLQISPSYRGDTVLLSYAGTDGHTVAMQFYNTTTSKHYVGMYQADATQYDSPKNYEYTVSNKANWDHLREYQIAELPCLMGLADDAYALDPPEH